MNELPGRTEENWELITVPDIISVVISAILWFFRK